MNTARTAGWALDSRLVDEEEDDWKNETEVVRPRSSAY